MKLKPKFGEICFAATSSLLALMLALSVAGAQNASVINSALGTQTYKAEIPADKQELADKEDTNYFPAAYTTEDELRAAYEKLCREAEEEGIVLLKNDNSALPLEKGSKVSLFGQGSTTLNYATTGSSSTGSTTSYATLKAALEESKRLSVNPDLWDFYSSTEYTYNYGRQKGTNDFGITVYTIREAPYSALSGVSGTFAAYGDAAIMTISRNSGEGSDISTAYSDGLDGSYLSISKEEQDLLQSLTSLKKSGTFKKVIVLLNTAVGLQLDFLDPSTEAGSGIDVDACLWVGNTGSHGAYAIGEVLTGDINPSGRNVDTFAKDNFANPVMASWGANEYKKFSQEYTNAADYSWINSTNKYYGVYAEGIYVGYRYYETRYEDYVMGTGSAGDYDYDSVVAYPFGYGLSYSTFAYSDFSVTENKEDPSKLDVSVTVTNTSATPGKEVVQIYLQKPYTPYDKANGVEKASAELAGYAKTGTLAAAGDKDGKDSQTVAVTVDKELFKSYDSNTARTYILDAGDYYLTAAQDAHDAVNNILAAKMEEGTLPSAAASRMTASGNAALTGKVSVALDTVQTNLVTDASGNSANLTYSRSAETGNAITNRLDNADVNLYSGSGTNKVTYVSRNNWTGTWPKEAIKLSIATATMEKDLQSNSPQDEDGSEKPAYSQSNGMTLAMLRGKEYDHEDWDKLLDQMSFAEQALLITDGYHLTNAVPSVAKPATVDENGPTSVSGSVTGYCLPSEGIWAASFNDDLLERIGNLMGDDCIMAGEQGLYAPGVNIHRAPFCGRAHEYFSEDPYLTGMASAAEIKGIQERGVVAYVKHLAFNENETNRNGISIWLNEQSAREIYLVPFEYSMRPSMGNSHACMTSFNREGCTWTSACSGLLQDICRDEFGFDGFYITDASSGNGAVYMTYYDGIMAGTCLYDGTGTSSALDSYANSPRFCSMMREACHRIMYIVCNYSAAMNGVSQYTVMTSLTPWWQILITTIEVIAIILVIASAAVYIVAEVLKHKNPSDGGTDNGRPEDRA